MALACALGVSACRESSTPPSKIDAQTRLHGEAIYVATCLACHQHDGSGVPGFQPPLVGSPIIAGPADRLIEIALRGSAALPDEHLSPDGEDYNGVMPGFGQLPDDDLAALLSYVKATWGAGGVVTEADVRAERTRLGHANTE